MFSRSLFHQRQFTLTRFVVVCALLLIAALAMLKVIAPHSHAAARQQQPLSFEDRVAAQRAIEEVYWRHRIWPTDNPQPKPPLDAVLPEAALRAKVEEYLRMSRALEVYWQSPVSGAELQAEIERMARATRQPAVLAELWAALGHDPLLVAECLARPLLAEREFGLRMAECGLRNEGCEALGLMNSANPHEGQPKLKLTLTEVLQKEPQFDPQLSQRLWHAARRGDLTALTSLLDKSVDIDAKNATGITALMMATANGHAEVVSALLAKGANINAQDDDGRTASLLAAFYNHNNILQMLLADSPDRMPRNKDGMSPLMVAAFRANLTAVNTLIAKGDNPGASENENMTVLMWAVLGGDSKVVETILSQPGVGVNAKDAAGATALKLAELKGDSEIIRLLVKGGAKAEQQEQQMNIVSAILMVGSRKHTQFDLIDRIGLDQLIDETTAQDVLDGSLDMNEKDKDGSPLLPRAVVHGQLATVKALLSKGVDPNTRSANGVPALMWAITRQALARQNDAVVTALLEGGADVNAKSKDGGTPLMVAVAAGKIDLVKKLLAKGADVNARADDGSTAFQLAEKLAKDDGNISRRSGGIISGGAGREMVKLLKEAQKKQKR